MFCADRQLYDNADIMHLSRKQNICKVENDRIVRHKNFIIKTKLLTN